MKIHIGTKARGDTCIAVRSTSPLLLIVGSVVLPIGIVVGTQNSTIIAAIAGALVLISLIIMRHNVLTLVITIAIHLYFDWYLGLAFVAQIIMAVLLLVSFITRSPQYPWSGPRGKWLWGLFLFLSIFPSMRGVNTLDSVYYYFNVIFIAPLVCWLGVISARDSASLRQLLKVLTFFSVLLAIHTIIQTTTGVFLFKSTRYDAYLTLVASNYALGSSGVSRAGSFLINPDSNGGFFGIMVFLPLGLFIESPSLKGKIVYLISVLLMLTALLFTYSTGGFSAVAAGLIAFIGFVGRPRYRVLLPTVVGFAVLVTFITFPKQMQILVQHAGDPYELLLRRGAWATALQVIRANPLTGLGMGRYVYLERSNPYRVPEQFVAVDHPHNSYLELAALGGIPIAVIFVLLLLGTFWFAVRNWVHANAQERTLIACGIATGIALSFDSISNAGWTLSPLEVIGWLLLGAISSPLLEKQLENNTAKKEEKKHHISVTIMEQA